MSRYLRMIAASSVLLFALLPVAGAAGSHQTDAGSEATAPDPVSDDNLLCDPDFESQNNFDCWYFPFSDPDNAAELGGTDAHGGTYAVDLCGLRATDCLGEVYQLFRLPPNITDGGFSAWIKASSDDGTNDCSTNVTVRLQSDATDSIDLQECEEDMSGQWAFHEAEHTLLVTWLKDHEGKRVYVSANGRGAETEGATDVTADMRVDDLVLSVTYLPITKVYRELTFNLKGHLHQSGVLSLVDEGGPGACFKQRQVKIQRKVNGEWKTLQRVFTDNTGAYSSSTRDRPGEYRAWSSRRFLSDTVMCQRVGSPSKTHTH